MKDAPPQTFANDSISLHLAEVKSTAPSALISSLQIPAHFHKASRNNNHEMTPTSTSGPNPGPVADASSKRNYSYPPAVASPIQPPPTARSTQGLAEAQKYFSPAPVSAATVYQNNRVPGEPGHTTVRTIASDQVEPRASSIGASSPQHANDARPINEPPAIPNILIFGETGTGKSSVINMIAGQPVAGVSGDAQGYTFGSIVHSVAISGTTRVEFWDTAGLNEAEHGTVPADQAMKNLQELVGNLHGGVSLLVYCIRGSRYRDIWKINYDLFSGIVCQGRVPVVLVVTGLEDESPMENWWTENGEELARHGLTFAGHACVTSTRGKQLKSGEYMYQEEFDESRIAARNLILDNCTRSPWIMDRRMWLSEIASKMEIYYGTESSSERYESDDRAAEMRGGHRNGLGFLLVNFFTWVKCLMHMAEPREQEDGRRRGRGYQS